MRLAPVLVLLLLVAACGSPDGPSGEPVVWRLDRLQPESACRFEVLGSPRVVGQGDRAAVEFDGVDDALIADCNPLQGLEEFTVEVVFRPDSGGAAEQRFVHVQETGSRNRVLIETRLPGAGRWFLDTYMRTGGEKHTLFAKRFRHPLDRWHHAALVVGQGKMQHYVNGRGELGRPVDVVPLGEGRVSIGARINLVHWYRGAISEVRFTPRALPPEEFRLPASRPAEE